MRTMRLLMAAGAISSAMAGAIALQYITPLPAEPGTESRSRRKARRTKANQRAALKEKRKKRRKRKK